MSEMTISHNWRRISQEIGWRAATYSRDFAVDPVAGKEEGIFRFQDLKSLNSLDLPAKKGMWWWVYAPLLMELLLGGENSDALWVALGHHTGTARSPERQWFYFLPEDWSDHAQFEQLFRLATFLSYNASFSDRSPEYIMLSTSLLEELAMHGKDEDGKYPMLYSLVITLSGEEPISWLSCAHPAYPWRALDADWRPLRERLVQVPIAQLFMDEEGRLSDLRNTLADYCDKPADYDSPSLRFFSKDQLGKAFTKEYEASLIDRRKSFEHHLRMDSLLGDPDSPNSLAYWCDFWVKQKPGDLSLMQARLLQYVLWMHDVASGSRWSHILTVPAWLPATERGGRSGSIVVCLRKDNRWMAETAGSYSKYLYQLVDFVNSFRAGSLNVAAESKFSQEQQDKHHFAHEFMGPLNTLASDQKVRELSPLARGMIRRLLYYTQTWTYQPEPLLDRRPINFKEVVFESLAVFYNKIRSRHGIDKRPLTYSLNSREDEILRKKVGKALQDLRGSPDIASSIASKIGFDINDLNDLELPETAWANMIETMFFLGLVQASYHAFLSSCWSTIDMRPYLYIHIAPRENSWTITIGNRAIESVNGEVDVHDTWPLKRFAEAIPGCEVDGPRASSKGPDKWAVTVALGSELFGGSR